MKTAPLPLAVKATHGCRIVLADGRELIDGIASWWTACHGYNHPHIRAAVERQLATMPHVMFGGLVHEQALTLARRLAGLLGSGNLDRVFFSESGSVAVEVALKMALQYWRNRGIFGRDRIVAFKGGYHGDTSGAMAISDPESGFHGTLTGALPQQIIVDLPVDEASTVALGGCWRSVSSTSRQSSSSLWCRAPAACIFTMRVCCAGCARSRTGIRRSVDFR